MLKAELRSKMFQVDSEWARVEDIFTGDFFGALDYLPREIHLASFVRAIAELNDGAMLPDLSRTDWNSVEMIFWPRESVDGQQVEPDVIIVSNAWLIIVEPLLRTQSILPRVTFFQKWNR